MATLRLNAPNVRSNIRKLDRFLSIHDIEWTLVTKVLGGHREALRAVLEEDALTQAHSVADARLSGLQAVREIRPELPTLYLKPPPLELAADVVRYADYSLNTSRSTLRALSRAAVQQDRTHRVIIMVELGELREGVLRDEIVDFYSEVFDLPHIEVMGLGANLGCLHGVKPNFDKMMQLCLYRQLLEKHFDCQLPLISGGSSISLPHVGTRRLPEEINHLRIGEAAFFGTSPLNCEPFRDLSTDTFDFSAHVIEKSEKHQQPRNTCPDASIGHTAQRSTGDPEEATERCIVDFGLVDADSSDLTPKDDDVHFAGTTSDMTIFDVGASEQSYDVGDSIHLAPSYMAAARLMHSKYIEKDIEGRPGRSPETSRSPELTRPFQPA